MLFVLWGGCGRWNSTLDLLRFTPFGASDVASDPLSFPDLGLLLSLPSPVAAAACCAAMSFLDALPLFLRSRAYSQVNPNSTQCAHGFLPSHLVRSWLHWSHARDIRLLTGWPFEFEAWGPFGVEFAGPRSIPSTLPLL